ncbi:hypothetical protein F4777DRAFT_580413 [Nemania sp. FL0916]|nr:hypothetical protein F4777DRAFT_580413 [Nemania sp. FL0916]
MANLPSIDTQAKVASDAAQSFVEHFYDSLNKRQPLAQFYASASPRLAGASLKPDISINGRVLDSVAGYEALLDAQGKPVYYSVASFDAHPVNPNFSIGCPDNLSSSATAGGGDEGGKGKIAKSVRDGDRLSFAVQVSGTVKYGKPGDATATAAAAASGGFGSIGTGGAQGKDAQDKEASSPESAFTESWLLVPHWEALGRNASRGLRRWLVVSQNFRAF